MNTKQLLLAIATIGVILTSCVDNSPTKTTTTGGTTAFNTYLNPNITYGSVTDIDGNKYATVTIGTQTWMAENLRVTHYRNGDAISNVTDNNTWQKLTNGAQCTYENTNTQDTITKYGRLYNFYTVSDIRSLAPLGWHVATDVDWTTLRIFLNKNYGSDLNTAKALASTKGWYLSSRTDDVGNNPSINNSTGFSAFPAGSRSIDGNFSKSANQCSWWKPSGIVGTYTGYFQFMYSDDGLIGGYNGASYNKAGYSVRCVKD